jgi:NADH-ubiquinone oxidoreductase chain 1
MISSFIVTIGVILCVALMTLAERKVMSGMQRRIGPNKVGYLGVLQPFSGMCKYIFSFIFPFIIK